MMLKMTEPGKRGATKQYDPQKGRLSMGVLKVASSPPQPCVATGFRFNTTILGTPSPNSKDFTGLVDQKHATSPGFLQTPKTGRLGIPPHGQIIGRTAARQDSCTLPVFRHENSSRAPPSLMTEARPSDSPKTNGTYTLRHRILN